MRARAAIAGTLFLLACLPSGPPAAAPDPFGGSVARPTEIRLEVQNHNFQDARLYAIRDAGGRLSLGTVGGKQDATFSLDWNMVQELRIEINLLAGPTCTTETLHVYPGDILELQISAVFTQSSFCR